VWFPQTAFAAYVWLKRCALVHVQDVAKKKFTQHRPAIAFG